MPDLCTTCGEPDCIVLHKPAKGSGWIDRREKRKQITAEEDAAKAIVRREDRVCRWPHCDYCRRYKPPLEVAHVVRAKGMGGDHGTVSEPEHLMLLDRLTHADQEQHRRDVRPLTDRGTRGPCEFWLETRDGWVLIARESAPFVYERD